MVEDDELRREVVRRLFYLITVTAEDAATIAAEGQSAEAETSELPEAAARLRAAGELIEIASSTIEAIAADTDTAGSARA